MKEKLTNEEIKEIIYLIEDEREHGLKVMKECYNAPLLLEEWRKTILHYDNIINKLKEKQKNDV